MKKLFYFFFLVSFPIITSCQEWKQNEPNPNALCAAPNFQYAVAFSSDADGNSYYAWADYRANDFIDIYAQKLNKRGVAQWAKDGLKIGRILDKNQFIYTSKLIKPDGQGGAYVVWHRCIDENNPSRQMLYAQHVLTDGKLLWAEGGLKVSDMELSTIDSYDDVMEINDLKSDKLQFIFNAFNGVVNTIYVKKLTYAGIEAEKETKLLSSTGIQTKVQYDENKAQFVALIKNQDIDFTFQTFDASLKPIIEPVAFTKNTFFGKSRIDLFKIDAEGNTFIGRTYSNDSQKAVYAHKINKDGKVLWGENGVNLGSLSAFDIQISPTFDGGGITTWIETADKQNPFRIAKLNADGSIKWQKNVFTPTSDKNYFLPNKLISDGKDGVYTLWLAPKDIGYNLTVQHFDILGNNLFPTSGAVISDFTFYSDYRLILHPNGGVIVLYGANKEKEDGRGGSVDLYTNYFTAKGAVGMPNSITISSASGASVCIGGNLKLTIQSEVDFEKDNRFRVAISDKNGNFANPPIILPTVNNSPNNIEVKVNENLESGTYKVKILSSSPVIESNVVEVNLGKVTATASNSGPFNQGEDIKLKSSGGSKYEWTGVNNFTSTEQNPTIPKSTLAMAGVYTVKVTDANGCTATAQTAVQVNAVLANENPTDVDVKVFPNPSAEVLRVRFYGIANEKVKISLLDMGGKLHRSKEVVALGGMQEEEISIENLSSGNYLLKLESKNKNTSKKVVLQ